MNLDQFLQAYEGKTVGYPDGQYLGEFYFRQLMWYNNNMPFTKGHPPYNKKGFKHSKESKLKMSKSHTGKRLSPEHVEKLRLSLIGRPVSPETRKKIGDSQRGEKHYNWKGDNITYRRLHNWIVDNYGKANHCQQCNTKTAKVYDWANISGKYLRDVSDYIQLCRKCHIKYDETEERIKQRNKCLDMGRTEVPVNKYDLSGYYICSYDSISDAANDVGVSYPGISRCISGKQNTSGGYTWKKA